MDKTTNNYHAEIWPANLNVSAASFAVWALILTFIAAF